jgi:hypothetical protein
MARENIPGTDMPISFLIGIFLFGFITAAQADAPASPAAPAVPAPDKRVALVIGNNAYKELKMPGNPGADARNLAQTDGLTEFRQAPAVPKELRDASRADARRRRVAWIPQVAAQIAEMPFQEARAAAKAAFDAGEYAKAATAQAKLVEAQEKAERAAAGRPGAQTATALLELSWYRLFAHDFKGSLAASDRAIAAQPDLLPAVLNRAHALMFLGRSWEARALYARNKGQDVKGYGQWEAVVQDDFKEFEKRGLKNPQIAEIRALLAPK